MNDTNALVRGREIRDTRRWKDDERRDED